VSAVNGGGFDVPVLRYRAMAFDVSAPALFSRNGRECWYRYGWDDLDPCNLLSGFGASAKPSLNDAFSSGLVAAKDRLLVYFAAERDKWGTVIRKAHIRLE